MKATSTRLAISLLLLGLVSTPAHAGPATSVSSAADQAARQMGEAFKPLWGTVLSVLPDHRFVLDIAADNDVYVGMEMQVFREGEPFKHPVTGKVLGRLDKQIGVVRVVEVKEQFSLAEKVSLEKGEQIGQGDGVRVTAARILVGLTNVSSSVVGEGPARVLSREIETALLKTGRFEVIDERVMRTTLEKQQVADTVPLTDPHALTMLRSTLRLHAVIVPVVRAVEQGWDVDLEAVSTFSSRPLYLASAEVRTATAARAATAAPAPTAAPATTAAPAATTPQPAPQEPQLGPPAPAGPTTVASNADPEGGPLPAWLGPPRPDASPLNPHFTKNPYFGVRGRTGPRGKPAYYIQPILPGLKRIAFGDLDGDGQDEMVGITDEKVMVFGWTGHSMALKKTWVASEMDTYILVDVADINQNGRSEIFVTSVDSKQVGKIRWVSDLKSFVLELEGEDLVPIWENVSLYFRVLKYPKFPEGVLLTQPIGRHTQFGDPIRRFAWDGEAYVPDPEWVFPTGVRLDSFALVDATGDKEEEFVFLGTDGLIRILDQDGKKLAETNEPLGYYDHISFTQEAHPLEVKVVSSDYRIEEHTIERWMQRRVLVTNLRPNGAPGILVGANYGAAISNIIKALDITDSSRVVHYAWDGKTLAQEWTSDLSRTSYVADYGLTRIWGTPAMVILSLDRGLLKKTEGILEIYRLVPPQSKDATARPVTVLREQGAISGPPMTDDPRRETAGNQQEQTQK